MSTGVKINGINMFINKLETVEEIIDIDELKKEFELDEGETGFYKLSFSKKELLGTATANLTYNRPPIGPIKRGLYCTFCDRVGPKDHEQTCSFPEDDDKLNLTISGFNENILKKLNYDGDYKTLKDSIQNKTLTQEQLNEILLIQDEITVTDGTFDIESNLNVLTNISYLGIYTKRGPKKLVAKTQTTQFLNNVIISYEENDNKTSIRISKNGLINLVNVPEDIEARQRLITELIKRINDSDSVDYDAFKRLTTFDKYTYIPDKSYIHSMTGQFTLNALQQPGNQVNFENLNNLISPYDSMGNLDRSDVTTIETGVFGDKIINFGGIKIIEWEYSLGRLTRKQVMSKEYIRFTSIPDNGVKLTAIINKNGPVMMTLSLCTDKQIRKGLCGQGTSVIREDLFKDVQFLFDKLFDSEPELLIKKSLDTTSKKPALIFNTVSGYAGPDRKTRGRNVAGQSYIEDMRPVPFSWKGNCPDPNYQYIAPQGQQHTKGDNLWYPVCETKTTDSIAMMKKYLRKGFPLNDEQAAMYDIIYDDLGEDLGSGIIVPDSTVAGATAEVKIDGVFQKVTVVDRVSKKNNEFRVKIGDKTVKVKGENFKRDSRGFPGLESFNRSQLLNCIQKNLIKFDLIINESGKIIKNKTSELNEKFNQENATKFLSIFEQNKITNTNFTVNNLDKFTTSIYTVSSVPNECINFFLVLSPEGNFYINNMLNSLECQISNKFDDTIILNGYLKYNDIERMNEYHVIDIVYKNSPLTENNFQERQRILFYLQSLVFSTITDEIFVYPDAYDNIIEASYEMIESNREIKLIFIESTCCNYIIWGNKDTYKDTFALQIIDKSGQIIKFGYNGRSIPEGINLDFLNNYAFHQKKDIPANFFVGDYYNIKINRDANDKVVANRKISIVNKTEMTKTFDETIDILLTKFTPIESGFFSDPEKWITIDKTYTYSGGLLSVS
tara:strand:+ start:916 stop:3774 length:2859 start_codon:yes stop_codon:yes gene_type:complete